MATGGIFTLITNDGKQDCMLMATELLRKRLCRIKEARKNAGLDPTPTLVDIEKTHILFMNTHFKPFAALGYEYNKVLSSSGGATLGSTIQFSIPQFGDFFHDMALHVKFDEPTITEGATPTYRWCEYIGERLCKKTVFTVNGNTLDEYHSEDYAFYRQLELPSHKVAGYNACVGQERVEQVECYQSTATPTNSRMISHYSDGYQTPKTSHGEVELFVPLLFWFNKNPKLAIPSVSIPFGQRFIEITTATQAELVGQEIRGDAVSGTMGAVTMNTCELYVNNIFVNPEIHDVYIKRIGFNLIRVHRRQATKLTAQSGEVLINNFKWPIESFAVGFRPVGNVDVNNNDYNGGINHLDHWHYFSRVARADLVGVPLTAYVDLQSTTIDKMTIRAHGIDIYNEFPSKFYNAYIPFARRGAVSTPTDIGIHMVTFNMFPGMYQPSGHINVSRAREFYLNYDSANVSTPIAKSTPVDMIASAKALNFLLISDGSAVLRYST